MKFDVVIAGGGFAGAYCARVLGKALGAAGVKRVALIAERNVLVFQPMLAEVAGAALAPLDVVNPLREFCRHVDVLQGAIHKIDWARKELVLDGGRFTRNHLVQFDQLVLALGSVTDMSRVPGMTEYAWPMKTVADALRLRAAIVNRLEEANLVEDEQVRARLLTFVIVGGGYTGVETAGQLGGLLHEVKHLYANLAKTGLRVVLVHSRPHLLEEIGEKLGDYAQRVLEKSGMEVRLGMRVAEITAGRVILANGEFIEAHTVVSTVGNAPNPVVLDLCKQLGLETDKGRVPTDAMMRAVGQTNLWVIGDCAAVPWNDRGVLKVSPPTAQLAVRQGKQLGKNLALSLSGGELRPFSYRYMGQLATVGERAAVAEVFGRHFSGFIAWWLWRTIYLAKLPGTARKLRVMMDWTFDLFFPRDISVVLPPAEDILRAIHLEKGEVLFQRGDQARAFYYVRRGSLELEAEAGGPREILAVGSVIEQERISADDQWKVAATAAESSDVIVIRGKALQMLRTELKLVRRNAES